MSMSPSAEPGSFHCLGVGEASVMSPKYKQIVSCRLLVPLLGPRGSLGDVIRVLKHWAFWDTLMVFRETDTGSFIQPIVIE